jgi:hypothetical protein
MFADDELSSEKSLAFDKLNIRVLKDIRVIRDIRDIRDISVIRVIRVAKVICVIREVLLRLFISVIWEARVFGAIR